MKKIILTMLCMITALSCMVFAVSGENYIEIQQTETAVPEFSDSESFNYSFADKEIQYSNFVISPQITNAGIRMTFKATSASHTVTMKVIRKDTGAVVYSEPLSVLNGFKQEIFLDATYLVKGMEYYLELSSPSDSLASGCIMISSGDVHAYDTNVDTIREKQLEFASQYEYCEGDFDKSFMLYPGILYTSGIEYAEDGTVYECPAIYIDAHAMYVNDFELRKGATKFIINGGENRYFDQGVIHNSRLLVPADVFREVGCEVNFDENSYVTTISKDETVLEILPNLIGMRKNQADGFYVPLEVCARFIGDTIYVPVRAVSNEFGLAVDWDGVTNTVSLSNIE